MITRRSLTRSLLLLPLALCACATTAPQAVTCPQLPPVPAPLMQPPPRLLQTASKLQSLLFAPATKPTPASASSVRK